MRSFLVILMFFFNSGFREPKHCKLSDRIFVPYNKELKKQKNLFLCGAGGAMMGDIQKVNASYVSFERLNVQQARSLFVEVMEGYLSRYNGNEEIRPYLHNYPFTVDNFEVKIRFENEQKKHMDGGYVALMYIGRDRRLLYRAYNHEKNEFESLYEEPYEVARAIVRGESISPVIDSKSNSEQK